MLKPGPLSGKTLGGKYLLGELLGKGGFGAVYKAENQLLRRQQAVKVLLEEHFSDGKFRDRFLREARTLGALDHASIVHVDDIGMEGNLIYLVMPYISGGTLQDILKARSGPLRLDEVTRYLEQICSALGYAHAQGVVHLDLKPLNLLVHRDGRLLLSDFGLAHLMEQGAIEGGTSLQFGSPLYMAPEHFEGKPGQRSDLYALGVILYQMLTGRRPFEASTPVAVMRKHLTEPPPSLHAARPDLPVALDAVIAKALAKQPAQRYGRAGELLFDYRAALGGQMLQFSSGAEQTQQARVYLDPTQRAAHPPGSPPGRGSGSPPPVPSSQPGARPTAGQYAPTAVWPGAPRGGVARPPAAAVPKKVTIWTPGFSWLFLGVVVFEVILLAVLALGNPATSYDSVSQQSYNDYPFLFSFYAACCDANQRYFTTPGFRSATSTNAIVLAWLVLLVTCLVGIISVRSWWIRLGFVFQVAAVLIANLMYRLVLNAAAGENLVLSCIAYLVVATHLSIFCIFYAFVRLARSGPRLPELEIWYPVGDALYQTFIQPLPEFLRAIFKLLGVIIRFLINLLTLPPFLLLRPTILYRPGNVKYIGIAFLLMAGWYILVGTYAYIFNSEWWVYYAAFLYPTLCFILAFLLLIQTERVRKKAQKQPAPVRQP